ncbi:MAG: hypothetical protein M3R68_05205 [Acidobacteriota bacterium]|nr:hypothetical protein [Acidobacteriota bacterium]
MSFLVFGYDLAWQGVGINTTISKNSNAMMAFDHRTIRSCLERTWLSRNKRVLQFVVCQLAEEVELHLV